MLIVFTGGHGGLFVGYRLLYTRHALSFCLPVTAHTGPACGLISVAIPEKNSLPAVSSALTAKMLREHHQTQIQDKKRAEDLGVLLGIRNGHGSKQATGAVSNVVHTSEGLVLGYLESNFLSFSPTKSHCKCFCTNASKEKSPLFVILR